MVHGGAGGWDRSSERYAEAILACRAAAFSGREALANDLSALDAVEVAVRALEDSPVLDAGRGSYPNLEGVVELDAIIMDGETLALGAVAAVQRVLNPISLARRVMTDCSHNFLVAHGAGAFADAIGFPRCSSSDLIVEAQLAPEQNMERTSHEGSGRIIIPSAQEGNTVGAVALDVRGNVAAATSTGGTRNKMPGRVGDSPLVGSGAYADNMTGAVSATGHGEDLMKILISKCVCDFLDRGADIQDACLSAVDMLEKRVGGVGGLIAVDPRGSIGLAYNTVAMPYAYAAVGGETVSGG